MSDRIKWRFTPPCGGRPSHPAPDPLEAAFQSTPPVWGATRPKQIVIRVSEEELAQIKEKVEQSGKSQQQYIIEALTQSNIVNLDGLKEIYPELKRQGNNLNQIAKKLNENGYVDYKQELPNTMKEVREVWQLLKQYLQKQA